jgi:hypothetical protein
MFTYMTKQAALSKTPHALADGLMLVFQYPAKRAWDIYSVCCPEPVPA